MSNRTDRFFRRKEKLQNEKELNIVSDNELVSELKNSELDMEKFNKIFELQEKKFDFSSNDEMNSPANEILAEIRGKFDQEKFDYLIISCKETVLDSIIKPFGLAKILFEDKDGGNVTTEHNFKKGITANEEDNKKFQEWKETNIGSINREPYDKIIKIDRNGNPVINKKGNPIKQDFNTIKKKEIYNNMYEGEDIKDGYTGKTLGKKTQNSVQKEKQIDLEHITPVSEIEKDSKNHIYADGKTADERQSYRVDMARNDKNLTLAEGSLNSSKNDKDLKKWANSEVSAKHAKETGNLNMTNDKYYNLDEELVNKEYKKSKDFIKRQQLKQQIKKDGSELLVTGGKEGLKMGLQQSLGILIKEFAEAVFFEIKDIYKNGLKNGKLNKDFLDVLKDRLHKISKKVLSKWKDVVTAFKDGIISGFFSNLITYIINTFLSTGKRFVRIIREGFFSLLKAIKLLIMPPEGFTDKQAAHEATKLISTGVIVAGGILIEEGVEKFLQTVPILSTFAQIISPVIVGIVTGLLSILSVYILDKIDLFKVNNRAKHEFVMNELEKRIEGVLEEVDNLYSVFEVPQLT